MSCHRSTAMVVADIVRIAPTIHLVWEANRFSINNRALARASRDSAWWADSDDRRLVVATQMANRQMLVPLIRRFYENRRDHPIAPADGQERENRQTARLRRVPPPAAASSAPERVPPYPLRGSKNT